MGISDSYAAGYGRAKQPKRSLMPMISKVAAMQKPKKTKRRVTVAPQEEEKKKGGGGSEPAKTKGAALKSDSGAFFR